MGLSASLTSYLSLRISELYKLFNYACQGRITRTKKHMEEQQKENLKNAEFRGAVLSKLEAIPLLRQELVNHLEEEMVELKEFNTRLQKLENWKIKVATLGGVAGATFSFIISFIFSKL